MASTTLLPVLDNHSELFDSIEYCVFGSVLAFSMGIGIYFGCFGSKNSTNAEYLHGNKKMHPIPVALSLLCSYVSSITLLGHPVEIYLFGTQIMVALLCYVPLTLSLVYLYVPFYFNLQLTSVYEYLEMRFSRLSRFFLSSINIIYSIFLMALVVYGPALALSQVTGLSHHMLVAVMFSVCIFYSSIGGIKAVLWTDSLQAFIMFASMATVVILGISKVGGLSIVWERASNSGRINFLNWDADPRTRHTVWTAFVGGYFTWLPMYANQAQVQRYISLPSLKEVKTALIINLFGLWIIMGLCYIGGLVIYATYYQCDPLSNGDIKAIDQLLPKFVMDTLGKYSGLPGLFVAGITCAGLSTVSSIVNSLAANVIEDCVKKLKSDLSESKLTLISKMISVVTGLIGFGFVFIAERMGSIFSVATTLLGILGGPTLGIFITGLIKLFQLDRRITYFKISGMFFPWANSWGSTSGMLTTFAFMCFLGFGSRYYKDELPVQFLKLETFGCSKKDSFKSFIYSSLISPLRTETSSVHWKDEEYSDIVKFFSLSDLWYPAVGCVLSVFLGLLFSLFVTYVLKKKSEPLSSRLFVPVVLKMWLKICPAQMERLVTFEDSTNTYLSSQAQDAAKSENLSQFPKEQNTCIILDIFSNDYIRNIVRLPELK